MQGIKLVFIKKNKRLSFLISAMTNKVGKEESKKKRWKIAG